MQPETITIHTDMHPNELGLITHYAHKLTSSQTILEIGTGTGGSIATIRESTEANIHTIEPNPLPRVAALLETHNIHTHTATSEEVARTWDNGPIDLLIVDGGHDFKSLITDIRCWFPFLAPDAYVIFDDYEPVHKGGLANLAVKICLDALIDTGLLFGIFRHYKVLVTQPTRLLNSTDITACSAFFNSLDPLDDTERAQAERLAGEIEPYFWIRFYAAKNKRLFRQNAETYSMLQLTKHEINTGDEVEDLSHRIAFKQVELNLLKMAIEGITTAKDS